MRISVWVNRLSELSLTQTTGMLISSAALRGHEVWVSALEELSLCPRGRVLAQARLAAGGLREAHFQSLRTASSQELDLLRCDLVLIRTNPGRDRARADLHEFALGLGEILQRRGTRVLNDPGGLRRAQSKLFLAGLPGGLRPLGMVGSDLGALEGYVRESESACVAKPLVGSRGEGVFKVTGQDPNLSAILKGLGESGPVLIQECLPGYEQGDLRLVVLEGKPLMLEGEYACVQRVPRKGEWRSNIHLGAVAQPAVPTPEQLEVATTLATHLLELGVVLAGLDLIGARAVELNVFSTGGLRDANRFHGLDFLQPILDSFERRVSAPGPLVPFGSALPRGKESA